MEERNFRRKGWGGREEGIEGLGVEEKKKDEVTRVHVALQH